MTTTPPGWYPDPENAAAQRWWDGTRWTEFTSAWAAAPDARPAPPASAPVIAPTPALPANSAPAKPWRPTASTIIVAAVAFLASIIVAVTGGIGAFLVSLSLFGLGASIYVLVAKRPSFLNLAPTRRAGGTALGVSAAVLLVGALLSPLHPAPPTPVADGPVAATSAATPLPAAAAAPKKSATPTPTPTPTPVVRTQTVDVPEQIPFGQTTYDEPTMDVGTTAIVTAGAPGTKVKRWEVVTIDGAEASRTLVSESVTVAPVDQVTAIGSRQPAPPPAPEPAPEPETEAPSDGCDPNYAGGCVPIASDVDCPGGSGNGPAYAPGQVQVIGSDIYDLDRDGDGIACD
jgi:hypothetical protein